MAFTLNRRLAQLVDSNGQLNTGKIPNDYITSDHVADNSITSAMLHTSFTVAASNLTSIDTDDVSEGLTNLYYTDARVDTEIDSYLSGGTGVTYSSGAISIGQDVGTTATPTFGNITTTGYLAGPATFTIDPAAVGDNTGTVVIAGNLQVDGTTTTINSTTMTVDDLNLTLASGALNAAAADGAGITVDGASATITYDGTNDEWDFNKDINVTGIVTATNLLIDTDVLVTDSTNDRVGINKTSPVTTLDVGGSIYFSSVLRGTADGSEATPTIQPGNDADTGLFRPATNTIGFTTAGSEAMRINSSGNVGIGKTNPAARLDLESGLLQAKGVAIFRHDTDVAGRFAGIGFAFGSNEPKASINLISSGGTNGVGHLGFFVDSNDDANALASGDEKMRITSTGKVGIGENSPDRELHVVSSGQGVAAFESTAAGLIIQGNSTTTDQIEIVGYKQNSSSYHDIRIRADAGGIYVKKTTGNVGIGYTSPSNALSVSGVITSGNTTGVGVGGTPSDANFGELGPGYLNLGRDDTASARQITFGKNGTVHSYIETTASAASNGLNIGGAYVGIGTTPGVELDIRRTANDYPLRIGSSQGEGRAIVYADVNASPTKYNWIAGTQYNINNGYEITPSTTVGGYTFSNPAIVVLSSGNVGIGDNTPSRQLEVSSSGSDVPQIRASYNATNYLDLKHNLINAVSSGGNDTLQLQTAGATALTIDVNQNVGIGAAPNTVVGQVDIASSAANYSTAPMITFRDTAGATDSRNWSIGNLAINYGDFHIGVGDNNSDYFDAPSHSKFMISKDGNVGINVVQPSQKLEVDGGVKISNANSRLYFGAEGGTSYRALEGNTAGTLLQIGEGFTKTVLQSGSVAIGSPDSNNQLAVIETTNYSPPALGSNGAHFGVFKRDAVTTGDYGYLLGVTSNGHVWQQAQRVDGTATAYDMYLQPSGGNVAIGTTSPDRTFHVVGDARFGDTVTTSAASYSITKDARRIGERGPNPLSWDNLDRSNSSYDNGSSISSFNSAYGVSFSPNGGSAGNTWILAEGPGGGIEWIWKGDTGNGSSGGQGGWDCGSIGVDSAYPYMLVNFVKRFSSVATGTYYYGTQNVYNQSGTSLSNPYMTITSTSNLPHGVWCADIHYIVPYGYTGNVSTQNRGLWRMDTGAGIQLWSGQFSGVNQYRSYPSHTTTHNIGFRTYLYYATVNDGTTLYWGQPAIYKCDGTQPTLAEIRGYNVNSNTSV